MSTTFDVLPTIQDIPRFSIILHLANEKLHQYFQHYCIDTSMKINARLESYEDYNCSVECADNVMSWETDKYVRFFLEDDIGGFEVRFEITDQLTQDIWCDEIELKKPNDEKKNLIEQALSVGHFWIFKRYSNQPLVYDLVYGIVAGTVAEVTQGIINTDDGAWDSSVFPATAKEFFESYFVPSAAVRQEYQQLTTALLDTLRSNYNPNSLPSLSHINKILKK